MMVIYTRSNSYHHPVGIIDVIVAIEPLFQYIIIVVIETN